MKKDLTLGLHLLIARTDYADQVEMIASARGVGVSVLCKEVIEYDNAWTERVLRSESLRQEDVIHDFVGLLKRDEHFVPKI
jgi:hypothetical protein